MGYASQFGTPSFGPPDQVGKVLCMVLLDQVRQSWDRCQKNICISRTISFCHPYSVSAKRIQNWTLRLASPSNWGDGQFGRPRCSPGTQVALSTMIQATHISCSSRETSYISVKISWAKHRLVILIQNDPRKFQHEFINTIDTDTVRRLLQVGFQKMFPNSIVQLKSAEWCQTVSLPEGNQHPQ